MNPTKNFVSSLLDFINILVQSFEILCNSANMFDAKRRFWWINVLLNTDAHSSKTISLFRTIMSKLRFLCQGGRAKDIFCTQIIIFALISDHYVNPSIWSEGICCIQSHHKSWWTNPEKWHFRCAQIFATRIWVSSRCKARQARTFWKLNIW